VAEQDDVVEVGAVRAQDAERIVTIIPADSGWRAMYGGQCEEAGLSRVVAWALVEDASGERRVVGMVVDPQDRRRIVTVHDTESQHSGVLTGYGYKER